MIQNPMENIVERGNWGHSSSVTMMLLGIEKLAGKRAC